MQSMTSLEPLVKEKADKLVERLLTEAASSSAHVADALKICSLFSFEVVCKAGFAKEFLGGDDDDSLSLLRAMDGSAMTMLFNAAIPWLRRSGFAKSAPGVIGKSYRSLAFWESRSRELVDHFLASTNENDIYLLTPYVKGTDGFLNRLLTRDELVEESMGIMFAGSGTTSITLTYLLYALSRSENQHIQQRLQQELTNASDDIATIKALPFLNAVIKETFRLYPTIISTLPRVLSEPITIESHVLPPGTVVGMQNLVHHRDPDIFPRSDVFLPERWLHATEEMEAALTPFSVGRRNCIGQNLAWLELYLAVSRIFSSVEFKLGSSMHDDDMEMEDRFNVTPRGKKLLLEVRKI